MLSKNALLASLKATVLRTPAIIKAFEKVRREDFIPEGRKELAYIDEPLHIGFGQTISQPYTVAVMTEALEPKAGQKILEVGAGSGYQAALLAEVVGSKGKVITVERLDELASYARQNLKKYKNVKVICADGSKGYEPEAPYDRIIITAAAPSVPQPLFDQLKEGGIIVIPVGRSYITQRLIKIRKLKRRRHEETLGPFVFVPLVGEFAFRE